MKPEWWRKKHSQHGPVPQPKRADPFYHENRDATNMVRWGHRRSLRTLSYEDHMLPLGEGESPLDWLLAWEEVERRERLA